MKLSFVIQVEKHLHYLRYFLGKLTLRKAQALRTAGKEQEAQALEALWGDGGSLRVAAHTLIGGLTGGSSGAAAGTPHCPSGS